MELQGEEISSGSQKCLSISAQKSGITTIPQPILNSMFEKANSLLSVPSNVITKPGATDGSFIVAGIGNKVHSVTPGKGGSLTCDRNCVNRTSKICEHILAVAQVKGMLQEFLAWFKRTRKRPAIMDMAEQAGPKNAGKKPSRRKRSNAKAQPVTEYVDLLNDQSAVPPSYENTQVPPHLLPQVPPQVHYPYFHHPSSTPIPIPSTSFANYGLPPSPFGNMNTGNAIPNLNHYSGPQSTFASSFQAYGASSGIPQNNKFGLKWVAGTRVKKCYGCGGDIVNPPTQSPDDLIVVYRDIRWYREKVSGQMQHSNTPQNVHFHLRVSCIKEKYPDFQKQMLIVSPDFTIRLNTEHIYRLTSEFGWLPPNFMT